MKKISLLFSISILIFFAAGAYAKVLKQLDLPADWKINSVVNVPVENMEVSSFLKQSITTPDGNLEINYYDCKTSETSSKLFRRFFEQKQAAYLNGGMLYTLSGDAIAVKNTLRFLGLPLLEQVKTTFPDIAEISNVTLINESFLEKAPLDAAVSAFGIKLKSAKTQLFTFENSKARLQVTYFLAENKAEARSGYQTARLKKSNELINFMFAEDFLIQLEWVK